jgi:sarcosine oxidase subunit gamma
MSEPALTLTPRGPVTGAERGALPGAEPGLIAVVRDGLGVATVLARKGASALLAERVRGRFGLDLPREPRRAWAADVAFVGTGPGTWLAVAERGGNEFAAALGRDLDGLAAVADQSDGYVVIRLTGPSARDTLAKLVPIDVHARAFTVGDAASTLASHIGVTLWRLEDERESSPTFELALFRSLARSFWHALAEAGAEYGFAGRVG